MEDLLSELFRQVAQAFGEADPFAEIAVTGTYGPCEREHRGPELAGVVEECPL